jgi:hypothetical protein
MRTQTTAASPVASTATRGYTPIASNDATSTGGDHAEVADEREIAEIVCTQAWPPGSAQLRETG